jgi:hypothetical protein
MYIWIRNCIPIVDTSVRCLFLGGRTTLGRGILLTLSEVRRHNDDDVKVANIESR